MNRNKGIVLHYKSKNKYNEWVIDNRHRAAETAVIFLTNITMWYMAPMSILTYITTSISVMMLYKLYVPPKIHPHPDKKFMGYDKSGKVRAYRINEYGEKEIIDEE